MICIEEDDAQRIALKLDSGRDPLGIRNRYDDPILDEHVMQFAQDMLEGSIPLPADAPRVRMSPVIAAALAGNGLDVATVAALAHIAGGVGIVGRDGDKVALIGSTHQDANTDGIGDYSWVEVGGMLLHHGRIEGGGIRSLSDTLMHGVVGMRLAEVVSHPVLDAMNLVITGTQDGSLLVGYGQQGENP